MAVAAAVGEGVVPGLLGRSGAGGDICDVLGIEGAVHVVDDGVIAAATTLSLLVDAHVGLVAAALSLLSGELDLVAGGLVDHGLLTELVLDVAEAAVDITVHLQCLLVGVGVGITESNLALELGDTSVLLGVITCDKVVVGTLAGVITASAIVVPVATVAIHQSRHHNAVQIGLASSNAGVPATQDVAQTIRAGAQQGQSAQRSSDDTSSQTALSDTASMLGEFHEFNLL